MKLSRPHYANFPVIIGSLFAILLVVSLLSDRASSKALALPSKEASGSPSVKPYELLYLDRNYPAEEANIDLYRGQLDALKAHDRTARRSRRGLDYPWTIEGPGNLGGRVNTIAVHPTNPMIVLLGYSQGGIYRTEDGGQSWIPVFDDQPTLSISHIIFDLHDEDRLWATTGDVNISGYPHLGSGLYRSDDAGKTWNYVGLDGNGVLSKVAVDPNNDNIIYVGSLGYPSHKGNERGLFRSVDGGLSWQKTLTVDDSTGIVDLVVDPNFAGVLYACAWTRIRTNTISQTKGPGTGLYKSLDYGATWQLIENGLPDGEHSRTSIEITNDGTIFISYIGDVTTGECTGDTETLVHIYKSYDGGASWDTIPAAFQHNLPCGIYGNFGWYFEAFKVNPDNPDDIFLLGVDLYRTTDGGLYWIDACPPWWTYEVHADKHDLIFAHDQLYLGTDGGAYITDLQQLNDWVDFEDIPSTQFYRTTWSPHHEDQYFGGAQDNGTSGGNKSFINAWPRIHGGDGFQPLFDPAEPDWMFALTQNGSVWLSKDGGLDFNNLNRGLRGTRYWDMPLIMDQFDSKMLYCGSDKVYRIDMRDSIPEWKPISGDLTRGDTILGSRYPALTALAQSPIDSRRLYAGTQDGLLWTSPDSGATWVNITDGTPGFFVTSIACSVVNPAGVFVTYSGYRDNDHQPYIFKSEDAGSTWIPIGTDLPMMGVNNLLVLPEGNDGTLLVGTDGGVYVTFDGGIQWERVGTNMPYMPVYDLDYNPDTKKIVAATFSRGLMTFPVEELEIISATDDDLNITAALTIYPTIARDYIMIETPWTDDKIADCRVSIHNMGGQLISSSVQVMGNRMMVQFDASTPAGVYCVRIQSGTMVKSSTFIME